MLTIRNIALDVERIANYVFSARGEVLPVHFKDWQISSNYIRTIFELLDVYYHKQLPDKAIAFVHKYSNWADKSLIEIGSEKADEIRLALNELIQLN